MSNNEFSDFRILKLKFSDKCNSHHQVLFKPHNVRVDEPLKPRERTLFCANIPPWATVEAVRKIFQLNGNIENIYFQLQPSVGPPPLPSADNDTFKPDPSSDPYAMESGFKFAYVVFDRPSGIKNALQKMDLTKEYFVNTGDEYTVVTGVKKWNQEYNKLWRNEKYISEEIDSHMKEYDKNVAELKEKNDELEEPDEDGWVTVTKKVDTKKGNPDHSKKDASKNKKNRRKKKKLELVNFYSHQIKEEKINKIQLLRKKFEQDKQKIAQMKTERKFRPF